MAESRRTVFQLLQLQIWNVSPHQCCALNSLNGDQTGHNPCVDERPRRWHHTGKCCVVCICRNKPVRVIGSVSVRVRMSAHELLDNVGEGIDRLLLSRHPMRFCFSPCANHPCSLAHTNGLFRCSFPSPLLLHIVHILQYIASYRTCHALELEQLTPFRTCNIQL